VQIRRGCLTHSTNKEDRSHLEGPPKRSASKKDFAIRPRRIQYSLGGGASGWKLRRWIFRKMKEMGGGESGGVKKGGRKDAQKKERDERRGDERRGRREKNGRSEE